jgi:hypothetical protein
MLDQYVLHTGFADGVAQINNLVPDFLVAPARILLLESNDELHNLLGDGRTTCIRPVLRSVVFFCNELPMPPHNSVHREQFGAPLQHLAIESLSLGSYPHSLTVGQQNSLVFFFLLLDKYSHLFS